MDPTQQAALPFFQYKPPINGQKNVASKPPIANRLIQTMISGGDSAIRNAIRPRTNVRIKLIFGSSRACAFCLARLSGSAPSCASNAWSDCPVWPFSSFSGFFQI